MSESPQSVGIIHKKSCCPTAFMKLASLPGTHFTRNILTRSTLLGTSSVGHRALWAHPRSMATGLSDKLKPAARVAGQRQDVW